MMNILIKIGIWLLGIAVLGATLVLCWPIAEWYLSHQIALGVDFGNMVSYVAQLSHQWRWPLLGWKSSTFAGMPWGLEYPSLHMYLALPWVKINGPYIGLEYYLIFNVGVFLVGSYLLFWRLAKNFLIAALLTVAVGYSVNVYGALIWGGSIPSFATQAFFPWVLWAVSNWLDREDLKTGKSWWVLAMILMGLSLWGHPLITFMYIFPAVGILGLFSRWKGRVREKLVWGSLMMLGIIVIGFPQVEKNLLSGWQSIVAVDKELDPGKIASSGKEGVDTPEEVKEFYRKQPLRLVQETQTGIWAVMIVGCGLWMLSWIVGRGFGKWTKVVPWVGWAGWLVGYIWIYGQGISIYHGGWYRVFWAVPPSMGAVGAVIWGEMEQNWLRAVKSWWWRTGVRLIMVVVIMGLGVEAYWLWSTDPGKNLETQMSTETKQSIALHTSSLADKWYYPLLNDKFFQLMQARQEWASGYPDVVNRLMTEKDLKELKKELSKGRTTGPGIDFETINYRLYSADQMVNMWWPGYFKMPLARGYVDPSFDKDQDRGMLFWLDASVNKGTKGDANEMIGSFKVPEDAAKNQAWFLADWYALGYMLGNYATDNPTALTPFLIGEKEETEKVTVKFKPINRKRTEEELVYYSLPKEAISPIALGTNALTILVIAKDSGYEAMMRTLGTLNWNSQMLIPIRGGKWVVKWSLEELKKFDVVYMTEYDYKMGNYKKVWNNLASYVKEGGKLVVDTGGEVKESDFGKIADKNGGSLSEVLPVSFTARKSLGKEWQVEYGEGIDERVKSGNFYPPEFNGQAWQFSVGQVRAGAKTLSKQAGEVIAASQEFGQGRALWLGSNWTYHVNRAYSMDEARLWAEWLKQIGVEPTKTEKLESEVDRVAEGKWRIINQGAKGVLIKEVNAGGWVAKVKGQGWGSKLNIYSAGPAAPGFVYVPLKATGTQIEVIAEWKGKWQDKVKLGLAAGLLLGGLVYLLVPGLVDRVMRFVGKRARKIMGSWWEKEE